LLEAFHQPPQPDSETEKETWEVIGEFFKIGGYRGELVIPYVVTESSKEETVAKIEDSSEVSE
jgi:hypothetical protein